MAPDIAIVDQGMSVLHGRTLALDRMLLEFNSVITSILEEKNLSVNITEALLAMQSNLALIRAESVSKIRESVSLMYGSFIHSREQAHQVFVEQMQVVGVAVRVIQDLRPDFDHGYHAISAGPISGGAATAVRKALDRLDSALRLTLAVRDKILTNMSAWLELPEPSSDGFALRQKKYGGRQSSHHDELDLDLGRLRPPLNGTGNGHVDGGDGQD
ncbi:uncharacterized protein LOC126792804 [Argentina anserina]|uniref:uncharacterized protein LOC126792804 n=1 Tax=Argentina anserina TaxID=57926 RepID=UPI0021766415|nr:uncharacterized protein LOC126792804 [Potentilla anserina]XP_050375241.1 uncharacterized protein LOC126792804 [Potentilla anserina]